MHQVRSAQVSADPRVCYVTRTAPPADPARRPRRRPAGASRPVAVRDLEALPGRGNQSQTAPVTGGRGHWGPDEPVTVFFLRLDS